MSFIVFYIIVNVGLKFSYGLSPPLGMALQSGSLTSNFHTDCICSDKHILERKTVNNLLPISLNMNRDWRFPIMYQCDKYILRRVCAAS